MTKITINKSDLEGKKNPGPGIYHFRLDGFDPKFAKEKPGQERSVNLRPKLVIINHGSLNGESIMTYTNTSYPPELFDLCHALGVKYENEEADNPSMPGEFQGPDDDPTKWQYIGPLAGQTGQLEVAEAVGKDGKTRSQIKKFFCRVQGCTARHRESLI